MYFFIMQHNDGEIFNPNIPFEERFKEEEIDVEAEKENTREAFKRIIKRNLGRKCKVND